jgi:hypothetical protein
VYFGPTGNGCVDYLRGIDSSHHTRSKDAGAGGKTAPAVPLLNAVQSKQLADGSVVGLNPAEWLVDLFTQADRDGRGGDFADAYDASQLKQVQMIGVLPHAVCCSLHAGLGCSVEEPSTVLRYLWLYGVVHSYINARIRLPEAHPAEALVRSRVNKAITCHNAKRILASSCPENAKRLTCIAAPGVCPQHGSYLRHACPFACAGQS